MEMMQISDYLHYGFRDVLRERYGGRVEPCRLFEDANSPVLVGGIVGRRQRQTQVNTGGANNVALVIAELAPLSPDGFIGDHTLISGNQKAEDGRCALERQIGSKVPTGEK
jgi:hypothetical protein